MVDEVKKETARDRANAYLAGMAARGFVPEPSSVAAYMQEIADEEGWEAD